MEQQIAMLPLTVIIPTMGLCPEMTTKLINHLSDYVGEIFLIDNLKKFSKKNLPENVIVTRQRQNLYVNPAWQFGVNNARYENILILNDDIYFDTNDGKILEEIIFQLNNKYYCVLGMSPDEMIKIDSVDEIEEYTNTEFYVTSIDIRPQNWGCGIAIKKQNFMKMHPDLKIFFGDDTQFLLSRLATKYEKERGEMHFKWYHLGSKSVNEVFNQKDYDFEYTIFHHSMSSLQLKFRDVLGHNNS